jgi:hypothetical protein
MGVIYDFKGLTGVSTTCPRVDEVLQLLLELTLTIFTGVWARSSSIWCMTHVGS